MRSVWRIFRLAITILLFLTSISGFQADAQDIELTTLLENVQDFVKSPTDDNFLIVDANSSLYVWNALTRERQVDLAGGAISARRNSLHWSPDGRFIVGGFDDVGRLWDAGTGELLHEFDEHPVNLIDEAAADYSMGVSDIAVSPDGTMIATSNLYDSTVLLWDSETYEVLYELSGHEAGRYPVGIAELEFSSDSAALVARKAVGGVTLWDARTGQRVRDMDGEVMRFSDDGTKLATGFGRLSSEIWIWDVVTGEQLTTLEAPLNISELEWAANDSIMVGNFTDFALLSEGFEYVGMGVRSWDVASNQPLYTFGIFSEDVIGMELGAGEVVIGIGVVQSSGSRLIWNQDNDHFYRREIASNEPGLTIETSSQNFRHFELNSSGTLIAANTDRQVFIWGFVTGELLDELSSDSAAVVKTAWLNDDTTLVMQFQDGKLFSWENISN